MPEPKKKKDRTIGEPFNPFEHILNYFMPPPFTPSYQQPLGIYPQDSLGTYYNQGGAGAGDWSRGGATPQGPSPTPYAGMQNPRAFQPPPLPTLPTQGGVNASVVPPGYKFNQFGSQAQAQGGFPVPGVPQADAGYAGHSGPAVANPYAGMQNPRANIAYDANLKKAPVKTGGATTGATAGASVGAEQGGNGTYRTWVDRDGMKRSSDELIDYAYRNIDKSVGQGFTDRFMSLHGVDPLTFYMRAFTDDPRAKGFELPGEMGAQAKGWLMSRAAYAAESDAKFLPGAVAEWQKVHGNVEIPQEQWERWWSISQSTGGQPLSVGVGQNAYGVY